MAGNEGRFETFAKHIMEAAAYLLYRQVIMSDRRRRSMLGSKKHCYIHKALKAPPLRSFLNTQLSAHDPTTT